MSRYIELKIRLGKLLSEKISHLSWMTTVDSTVGSTVDSTVYNTVGSTVDSTVEVRINASPAVDNIARKVFL
jgi:hypothetical protein